MCRSQTITAGRRAGRRGAAAVRRLRGARRSVQLGARGDEDCRSARGAPRAEALAGRPGPREPARAAATSSGCSSPGRGARLARPRPRARGARLPPAAGRSRGAVELGGAPAVARRPDADAAAHRRGTYGRPASGSSAARRAPVASARRARKAPASRCSSSGRYSTTKRSPRRADWSARGPRRAAASVVAGKRPAAAAAVRRLEVEQRVDAARSFSRCPSPAGSRGARTERNVATARPRASRRARYERLGTPGSRTWTTSNCRARARARGWHARRPARRGCCGGRWDRGARARPRPAASRHAAA